MRWIDYVFSGEGTTLCSRGLTEDIVIGKRTCIGDYDRLATAADKGCCALTASSHVGTPVPTGADREASPSRISPFLSVNAAQAMGGATPFRWTGLGLCVR